MPYTATERGLANPFNPESALPEAAEFLAELRREFGNLGLAAAAYNAGPGRVRDFIDGRGGMPRKPATMSMPSPAARWKTGPRSGARQGKMGLQNRPPVVCLLRF